MARVKVISNEELIAAIITNNTLAAAAEAAGISLRALHDRMRDPDFRIAYTDAKSEIIRGAVRTVNSHLTEALETVAGIMNDEQNNAAVRLQAAQTILSQSSKINDRLMSCEINFNNGF